jgi:hypothetical protein
MSKVVETFLADALRHEAVQSAMNQLVAKVVALLSPLLIGIVVIWSLMLIGIAVLVFRKGGGGGGGI